MEKAKLIYGCGADSFYATGLEMHDPYTWYQDSKGETHVLMSALEVDRARRVAKVDHVHAMGDVAEKLQESGLAVTLPNMVKWLVDDDAGVVEVPSKFPASLYSALFDKGVQMEVKCSPLFPSRAIKRKDEIEAIRFAQSINEKGFQRAFEVLEEAVIGGDDILMWRGEVLTSDILRGQINAMLAQFGSMSASGGPIVACGAQGADPHERGFGPLKANELIIIDSFPMADNFYWGDLTRTVVKGQPTEWQEKVFNAVKDSQEKALATVKAGVTGADVHAAATSALEQHGFDTGVDEQGRNYGFFHGTGHALGLEVHDDGPGIHPGNTEPLAEGMVVTIEPGIYYPEKGGARIEDIVVVTANGCENLTTLPKFLVIK